MTVTNPLLLNSTGQDMVTALKTIAAVISGGTTYDFTSWAKVQALVKDGIAPYALPFGSQILVPWTDKATNTAYTMPFDVVHHGKATLADGESVPAMFLQSHYCTPFGVQFNNYQAFYYASSAVLPAGTYNVTLGSSWGSKAVSGKTYQFTLTKDLPVGGQLSGFEALPDKDPTLWQVKAWASNTATTVTETVAVTEGSEGTNLGTLKFGGDGTLNCMQRTGYGYNRWGKSALRQFLNSNKGVNSWWTPQSTFDRFPNELLTKQGFLTGFADDFLAILTATKVTTALNTITDSADGTTEDTYDKFFLPSLQNIYAATQLADVEGPIWEYWQRASGMASPVPWSTNYPNMITYALENHASAQTGRLRSADRNNSYNPWCVSSSGYIDYNSAVNANRFAPACAIV